MTGVCLTEMGNHVVYLDVDAQECQEIRSSDFDVIKAARKELAIFDGRNLSARQPMKSPGVHYQRLGQGGHAASGGRLNGVKHSTIPAMLASVLTVR